MKYCISTTRSLTCGKLTIGTPMIELQPIPTAERITHQHTAGLRTPYDRIAEALGQPHWRDDTGFPGDPTHSRVTWRVRDRHTGATLVVWDHDADAPTPALTAVWRVAWTDGPDYPGSGRRLLDDTVGDEAGGEVD